MDKIKTEEIRVKIISIALISDFIFGGENVCSADEKAYEVYSARVQSSSNGSESESQSDDSGNTKKIISTPQPAWINQSGAAANNSTSVSLEDTVSGLTIANTGVKDKAKLIYNMGSTLGTAATLLMSRNGGGHSASEVAVALIDAGYNESAVTTYLGGSINQSNQTQVQSQTTTQEGAVTAAGGNNQDQSTVLHINTQGGKPIVVESGSQFSADQIDKIGTALGGISADKIPDGLYFTNNKNGGGAGDGLGINLGKDIPAEFFGETVVHEVAHVIDGQTAGHALMDDLFNQSDKNSSLDFLLNDDLLGPASRRNSSEDFAYTAEYYFRDSASVLSDALDKASQGHSLVLQKVLFVMEKLFSNGDTVTFFVDGNKGQSKTFSATKSSSGEIQSINGINVKNGDGSYNIEGLRKLLGK